MSKWADEEDFEALVILDYPPEDVFGIEKLVRARETFVALVLGNLYEVMRYHDPRHGLKFLGCLDRNLYSRISTLASGRSFHERELDDLRWAAAVLAFCQIAEITFDYASSIYELASAEGGMAAGAEISRFRIADNSDPRVFIDFALGRTTKIPESYLADVPSQDRTDPAEFEKRTNDFRINYIHALKIAGLGKRPISPVEKMISLVDWMANKFIFGAPALLFANRYFFPNRFRRMIKGLRKKDIQNAAWDLTLVQNWRRAALKGIKGTNPAILMTGDKAVQDMARRITAESDDEFRRHLLEPWGKNSREGLRVFNHYRQTWEAASRDPNRGQKVPNYQAQLRMIDDLEQVVLEAT